MGPVIKSGCVLALSDPLTTDQVSFRVQSINKGGYATILVYKDARVDMQRLNDVYGVGKWQRKHDVINGNVFCSVGIYDKDTGWAWVQDVGTPSQAEPVKGQASDSFKRACFNLGIGIELYDYPVIQVKLIGNGDKKDKDEWFLNNKKLDKWNKPKADSTWDLKLKEWKWFSQFENGKLSCLAAKDQNGNQRFKWGEYKKESNNG